MSIHANQHGKTPSSPRKAIRGANPTYKASVQEHAGEGSRGAKAREEGRKTGKPQEPVALTKDEARAPGFGDGHYRPASE